MRRITWSAIGYCVAWFVVGSCGPFAPARAGELTVVAVSDNTILGDSTDFSEATGDTFSVGRSGQDNGYRRGLLQFELGSISPLARIERVTLRLRLDHVAGQEILPRAFALHRSLSAWGEGSSTTGTGCGGGSGTTATLGDATWENAYYPDVFWSSYDPLVPSSGGGDFAPVPSAVTEVGLTPVTDTYYEWQTERGPGEPTGLIADVESWLQYPGQNFGWLMKGVDEETLRTVRRFNSKDEANEAWRPHLTIEYTDLPLGDTNSDYRVTSDDYTIWSQHYGLCGLDTSYISRLGQDYGDHTRDGCVSPADYTLWADNFYEPPENSPVPEPGAWFLAICGAAGVTVAIRRRLA